ncbi:hypothetical protein BJ742DRAFT_778507 [Cladochytrium replicatum]|nr:hypothetical protein BJ742DRAFT_778507 [Cladochytrium replicatum]
MSRPGHPYTHIHHPQRTPLTLLVAILLCLHLAKSDPVPPDAQLRLPLSLDDGITYRAINLVDPCAQALVQRTVNKTNCVALAKRGALVSLTVDRAGVARAVGSTLWDATFRLNINCFGYVKGKDTGYTTATDLDLVSTTSLVNNTVFQFRVPACNRLDVRASVTMDVRPRIGISESVELETVLFIDAAKSFSPQDLLFLDTIPALKPVVAAFSSLETLLTTLLTLLTILAAFTLFRSLRASILSHRRLHASKLRRLSTRPRLNPIRSALALPRPSMSSIRQQQPNQTRPSGAVELLARSIDPHAPGNHLNEKDLKALPLARTEFETLMELVPAIKEFGLHAVTGRIPISAVENENERQLGDETKRSLEVSEIETLGERRLAWGMIFPSRLVKVGNTCVVVRRRGGITVLPAWVTYEAAIRMCVFAHVGATVAAAAVVYGVWTGLVLGAGGNVIGKPGGQVFPGFLDFGAGAFNLSFGMWWIFGVAGMVWVGVKVDWKRTVKCSGAVMDMRAFAPPEAEEIMFSYGADPDLSRDVRAFARAMWEMGVGVWIDWLKAGFNLLLDSGGPLGPTVRKAVRDVNTVVLFVCPKYLRSRKCGHELIQALYFPEKIHIHVVEWDAFVERFVKFMIETVGISIHRITAHPQIPGRTKTYMVPKTSVVHLLATKGRGWMDFCAAMHAYTHRQADIYDLWWWLRNATTTSAIPPTAPPPPPRAVEPYNIRLLTPWSLDLRIPKRTIRLNNLWISGDVTQMGVRASSFPWRLAVVSLCVLAPFLDLAGFAARWVHLDSVAASCVKDVDVIVKGTNGQQTDSNAALMGGSVLYALCVDPFYQRGFANGPDSAFNILVPVAWNRFHAYAAKLNCGSQSPALLYPYYQIDTIVPCIRDLESYYKSAGFPTTTLIWPLFLHLMILFVVIGVMGRRSFLESTLTAPPALRTLLVATSLNRRSAALESKIAWMDNEEDNEPAVPYDHATPPKEKLSRKGANRGYSIYYGEAGKVVPENPGKGTGEKFAPRVYAAVHGDMSSPTCRTLIKFLDALELLLPGELRGFLDVLGFRTREDIPELRNVVWVDVYVVSDFGFLRRLYARRNEIDFERCVVVLDETQAFKTEIDRKGLWDSVEKKWLGGLVYVVAKEAGLGRDDAAEEVFRNLGGKMREAFVKSRRKYIVEIEKRVLEMMGRGAKSLERGASLVQGMAPTPPRKSMHQRRPSNSSAEMEHGGSRTGGGGIANGSQLGSATGPAHLPSVGYADMFGAWANGVAAGGTNSDRHASTATGTTADSGPMRRNGSGQSGSSNLNHSSSKQSVVSGVSTASVPQLSVVTGVGSNAGSTSGVLTPVRQAYWVGEHSEGGQGWPGQGQQFRERNSMASSLASVGIFGPPAPPPRSAPPAVPPSPKSRPITPQPMERVNTAGSQMSRNGSNGSRAQQLQQQLHPQIERVNTGASQASSGPLTGRISQPQTPISSGSRSQPQTPLERTYTSGSGGLSSGSRSQPQTPLERTYTSGSGASGSRSQPQTPIERSYTVGGSAVSGAGASNISLNYSAVGAPPYGRRPSTPAAGVQRGMQPGEVPVRVDLVRHAKDESMYPYKGPATGAYRPYQ